MIKFERSSSLLRVLERLVASPLAQPPADDAEAPLDAPGGGTGAIEVEQLVDAAEPLKHDAPSAEEPFVPAPATGAEIPTVARLFDALRVERGADGSLRIEAPPQAASALASLFDGMARLLRAVGAAPSGAATEVQRPTMSS